jgi:hypothetical protein
MLNPAPVTLACVMLALVPPELVRVTVWFCVLPVVTFPNDTLLGVATSCPGAIPSPETVKATLAGAVSCAPAACFLIFIVREETPLRVTLPLIAPADFGAKTTLNAALWPASIVTGKVSPLIEVVLTKTPTLPHTTVVAETATIAAVRRRARSVIGA